MSAPLKKKGERRDYDVYETPEWAVQALLDVIPINPSWTYLEPCRASGRFYNHMPLGSAWGEIREGVDYLNTDYPNHVDCIITNPPYSLAQEFVTKALDDVVSGTIDGVILNFLNANRLKRSLYRSRIRIILPPITTQALRLAVMRGKNHELIKLFDDGIRKFVKSGKYKELLDYWGIELELPLEEKAAAVPAK